MTNTPRTVQDVTRDDARGYTDSDMAEVDDNPEWTDAELAGARPFAEMFPDAAASIKRGRGPQKAPTKASVTLRLDREVLEHFKAGGKGWQVRMGEALKKVAGILTSAICHKRVPRGGGTDDFTSRRPAAPPAPDPSAVRRWLRPRAAPG